MAGKHEVTVEEMLALVPDEVQFIVTLYRTFLQVRSKVNISMKR
jgi:hypothetical protein